MLPETISDELVQLDFVDRRALVKMCWRPAYFARAIGEFLFLGIFDDPGDMAVALSNATSSNCKLGLHIT